MSRSVFPAILGLLLVTLILQGKSRSQSGRSRSADLEFVVYLSRHGVRSPTGKAAIYDKYSSAPWPVWEVSPGDLTPHGFRLMQQFGAFDRAMLAGEGLLTASGCNDAAHVTIYTDSDQRTRETGKALATGLFPNCQLSVQALPQGTEDPLFHFSRAGIPSTAPELAVAAVEERIGGSPDILTDLYREPLTTLDTILDTCGGVGTKGSSRQSLLKIPATIAPGKGDRYVDMRGPLNTASTLTENLLLEYTEGMSAADVGWGCVDGAKLRSFLVLHTAASDYTQRTIPIARAQASNLLDHIRRAFEQAASGKPVPGSVSRQGDKALFLVGHDTNLSNVSGLLHLSWIADGRRDDVPPGSALVFELWRLRSGTEEFVRVYYTSQTLEQMRSESALSSTNPPLRVPIYIQGCSGADLSCSWNDFNQLLRRSLDSASVRD